MNDLVRRLRSPAMCLYEWDADDGDIFREAADRISALEARVKELEASVSWYSGRHEEDDKIIDGIETELTASRQQVERLVEALKSTGLQWPNIVEALAAVEKERGNAPSSAAPQASAGMTGYAAGGNGEQE